jgi:hypothetical protein
MSFVIDHGLDHHHQSNNNSGGVMRIYIKKKDLDLADHGHVLHPQIMQNQHEVEVDLVRRKAKMMKVEEDGVRRTPSVSAEVVASTRALQVMAIKGGMNTWRKS